MAGFHFSYQRGSPEGADKTDGNDAREGKPQGGQAGCDDEQVEEIPGVLIF